MRVEITGLQDLVEMQRKLNGLKKGMKDLTENLLEETVGLVTDGFRAGKNPYGRKWANKVIPNGRKVLAGNTARLKRGWSRSGATVKATEFTIRNATEYAIYHQMGTGLYGPKRRRITPKNKKALAWTSGGEKYAFRSVKGVKKRLMIPDKRGLPKSWVREYRAVSEEWIKLRLVGEI